MCDDACVIEWPTWATEPVDVHPPDAAWQERGKQLRRQLTADLSTWLAAPVEHVGSTAVPDLSAKPILDLQAPVSDLTCAPDVAEALSATEWHWVPPELDQRPWRRFFVRVAQDRRVAHLHLLAQDDPRWTEQLAFRDALRADPALRRRYAALKRELAARYRTDREAYTAAKSDFVRTVLSQLR